MEVSGEGGQLLEAPGVAEPGGAAVGKQETGAVGELEVGSRRGVRVIGSYWQAGEHDQVA
jgi:hypothetical protein